MCPDVVDRVGEGDHRCLVRNAQRVLEARVRR